MKITTSVLALAMTIATAKAAITPNDASHKAAFDYIDAVRIHANALQIWGWAEPGFKEARSSALLQKELKAAGFVVQAGVAGMPTAFVASYRTGDGPIIGILAEYDALPGLDQARAVTIPQSKGAAAAHGCGHNLLGAASVEAARAIAKWMRETGIKGELRVYGSPAEEGGDGKAYMVREGLFSGVDAVLHWHPNDKTMVATHSLQGNIKTDFSFHGVPSHAAAAPQFGRSALAATQIMDVAVNSMRQFVVDGARIHNIIVDGGRAPNVVPAFAKSSYYVRHGDIAVVKDLQARLIRAAQGAAMASDTKVDFEIVGGVYPVLINETLAKLAQPSLVAAAENFRWANEDLSFARSMQTSLGTKPNQAETYSVEPLGPSRPALGGSSDVGDISYVVPTVGLSIMTWPTGTPPHSWASASASGSAFGTKGAAVAARAIVSTTINMMMNPNVLAEAKLELQRQVGADFRYAPLFGKRAPPLNYTDSLMAKQ
jgi:aminobenzoyl-glutamate utilization protein B